MIRFPPVVLLLQVPGLALADSAADLSTCVADNTSGKQRKDLARWVFFAMAAHPDFAAYATPELNAARDPTDKMVADLVMHLITEQCPTQANAAFRDRGAAGIQVAFEALGRLAMLELMTNPDTAAAMSGFQKYVNSEKVGEALLAK
jgi:hypothetical protein